MRHVLLVGIQHSGKSSAGRLLARKLGRRFADLDDELLKRNPPAATARELFASLGRELFRQREAEALAELLVSGDPLVIAAGGGLSDAPVDWEDARRRAVIVWIDIDDGIAWERVVRKGLPAYLSSKTEEEAKREFRARNAERRETYRKVSGIQLRADSTSAATAAKIQRMLP